MREDSRLSLDHAVLDHQHRELAAAADLAYKAHSNGDERMLLQQVEALHEMSAAHFAIEERLMGETDYGDAAVHAEQHREILDQIARCRAQLHAGRFACQSAKLMQFLQEWVASHTLNFDRDLAAHLRARQA